MQVALTLVNAGYFPEHPDALEVFQAPPTAFGDDPDGAEDALLWTSRLADEVPADDPNRYIVWSRLADQLFDRYRETNRESDAEGAVTLARRAVEAVGAGEDDAARLFTAYGLGRICYGVGLRSGDPEAAAEAVRAYRSALDLLPESDAGHADVAGNLVDAEQQLARIRLTDPAAWARGEGAAGASPDAPHLAAGDRAVEAMRDLDVDSTRQAVAALRAALSRPDWPSVAVYAEALGQLADCELYLFEVAGPSDLLDRALVDARGAHRLLPDDAAHRSRLSKMLRMRGSQRGVLADLWEARREAEAALASLSPDDPQWPESANIAGMAIRHLTGHRALPVDELDRGVDLHRRAVVESERRDGSPSVVYLTNCASALIVRAQLLQDPTDADEGLQLLEEAVRLGGLGVPGGQIILSNIATAATIKCDLGDADSLVEGLATCERVLDSLPEDYRFRSLPLMSVARLSWTRWRLASSTEDLDRAVSASLEGLTVAGQSNVFAPLALVACQALATRYARDHAAEDAARCRRVAQRARDLLGDDDLVGDLADIVAQLDEYAATWDAQEGVRREAATLAPLVAAREAAWTTSGLRLLDLMTLRAYPGDTGEVLDERVRLARALVAHTRGADQVQARAGLALALVEVCDRDDDAELLEEATRLVQDAVPPEDDAAGAGARMLGARVAVLGARAVAAGDPGLLLAAADLLDTHGAALSVLPAVVGEARLALARAGTTLATADDPEGLELSLAQLARVDDLLAGLSGPRDVRLLELAHSLDLALATTYRLRFEVHRDVEDLDRAIWYGNRVSSATGAIAHLIRFDVFGDRADLEAGIEGLQSAVETRTDPDDALAGDLAELAQALGNRAELDGSSRDLATALDHADQAISLAASGTEASIFARGVRASLLTRSVQAGADPGLLVQAIEDRIVAASDARLTRHDRVAQLINLSSLYRFRGTSGDGLSTDDLMRWAEVVTELEERSPGLGDAGCRGLVEAGTAWLHFAEMTEITEILGPRHDPRRATEHALALLRAAAAERASAVEVAQAHRALANVAERSGSWVEAVWAYRALFDLLDDMAPPWLERGDREGQLVRLGAFGPRAFAAALRADEAGTAVEFFERAQGALSGQAVRRARDLERLQAARPDLVADYMAALAAAEQAPAEEHVSTGPGSDERSARRSAWERAVHVLAEIRGQRGFETFQTSRSAAELLAGARAHNLVLLSLSEVGLDVLLLVGGQPSWVELPMPAEEVEQNVAAFTSGVEDFLSAATDEAATAANARTLTALSWLWDHVGEPVLAALERLVPAPDDPAILRRIVWMPAGALAIVPWHAVGRHHPAEERGRSVMDRVVSTYASSVTVLASTGERREPARASSAGAGGAEAVLVAMPVTVGADDLPGASHEVEWLADLLGDRAQVVGLPGTRTATREAMLELLPGARWTHFACHASFDPARPYTSALLLRDHRAAPFTAVDVSRLDLSRMELAFLGACSTGAPGRRPSGHPLHLASAFQLAGTGQVVSMLWPIDDDVELSLCQHFYAIVERRDDGDHALALHEAVLAQRAAAPFVPALWAPAVHWSA